METVDICSEDVRGGRGGVDAAADRDGGGYLSGEGVRGGGGGSDNEKIFLVYKEEEE